MEEQQKPTVPDLVFPADILEEEDLKNTQEEPPKESQESSVETEDPVEEVPEFKDLYNFYRKSNILTTEIEGPINQETFEQALIQQRQAEINYYQDLPVKNASDEAKALIQYARDNPGATLEDLKQFFEYSKPVAYGEEDLKEEEKAESYLRSVYKAAEYEDEVIDERIDMFKDSKGLTKEALREYKKDTAAREAYKNQKLQETKESKEAAQRANDEFVNNFNSQLKELEWNPERKREVVEVYTSGFYKNAIENLTQMPKAMIQLLDVVRHLDVEKGEINMDEYLKHLESKAAKNFKEKVESSWSSSVGRQSAAIRKDTKNDQEFEFADL